MSEDNEALDQDRVFELEGAVERLRSEVKAFRTGGKVAGVVGALAAHGKEPGLT